MTDDEISAFFDAVERLSTKEQVKRVKELCDTQGLEFTERACKHVRFKQWLLQHKREIFAFEVEQAKAQAVADKLGKWGL